MTFLRDIRNWLFPPADKDAYCERFVKPQMERAQALGIPHDDISQMWNDAMKYANPHIVGQAPGALFANLIDLWELHHTNQITDTEPLGTEDTTR